MSDEQQPDLTRRKQTFFLSAEFVITMIVQTGVFVVLGTTIINRVEARVAALESQQVTAERIARIEEKLAAVLVNQGDLRGDFRDLKRAIQSGDEHLLRQ